MLQSCSSLLRCRIVVISNPLPSCLDVMCTQTISSIKKQSTQRKYCLTCFTFYCLSLDCSLQPYSVCLACVSIYSSLSLRLLLQCCTKDTPCCLNITLLTSVSNLTANCSSALVT